MTDRGPAQVWPLAMFLADEMEVRNWRCTDVALRMPGDYGINVASVNFLLALADDPNLVLANETRDGLAAAFDVSPDYIAGLNRLWRENPDKRQPWTCPEHLLDGLTFPTEH